MVRLAAGTACLVIAAQAQARELSSMVVLGPDGVAQARVITDAASCPPLSVDGRLRPMRLRARAEMLPSRPTASRADLSKPAAFPVLTCEARLSKGVRRLRLAGAKLPVPRPLVRRIVVIGDTGCRLKAADSAYQACNDPRAYPFGQIAQHAAAWKPDLVLHVGDYLYRENPCPADKTGCAGTPWGYGWDAWKADFFEPAAPLLAAAPWIVVRGNHEDCARAGQGWWRLLDPRPLLPGRDCNDPASDIANDDSPPYAVPLGGGAQIVVLDMTTAPPAALSPNDPRHAQFAADKLELDRLAARAPYTLLTLHKPVLGFFATKDSPPKLLGNTASLQQVFAEHDAGLLPRRVGVVLSGHIHLWEQVGFATDHPSQFIAGFSGTDEDIVPLPARLPPDAAPAPGTTPNAFSSWIGGFGYMTLERRRLKRWDVKVWDLSGRVVNRCKIVGRRSWCETPKVAPRG